MFVIYSGAREEWEWPQSPPEMEDELDLQALQLGPPRAATIASTGPTSSVSWHFSSRQLQNFVLTFLRRNPKGRKTWLSRRIKTLSSL
jgi:hypothetical protein